MTERPCPDCGRPARAITVPFPSLAGGMVERVIASRCSACAAAQERAIAEGSRRALMGMVLERTEIPPEFDGLTLATHPNADARRIGGAFLAAAPNPLESLLAAREWTATVEQRVELARMQRAALRGMRPPGFFGQQGRGKTGAYAGIARVLVERGISVQIANVTLLLQSIDAHKSDGAASDRILRPLREAPMLVLDDLDKVSTSTYDGRPTAAAQRGFLALLSVQEYRMQHSLPTGVTANRSLGRLKSEVFSAFGVDGDAFCDRFLKTTGAWHELVAERTYRVGAA